MYLARKYQQQSTDNCLDVGLLLSPNLANFRFEFHVELLWVCKAISNTSHSVSYDIETPHKN